MLFRSMAFLIGMGTLATVLAQKKATPPAKTLTVLWAGDSMTAAPWGRRRLKSNFDKAGYRTEFVGSQFGANPEGGFTDGEHEGYPGCKIADVAAKLTAPDTGALARFPADIVLILLGTNDIGQGQVNGAADRLRECVVQIRRAKPKARIFVGTIPPILPNAFDGYDKHRGDVNVYNAAVRAVVAGLRKRDARIHLVDIHAALPATSDYIGDGVHPTGYGVAEEKDGYAHMGDAWFRAIQAVYPKPVVTRR